MSQKLQLIGKVTAMSAAFALMVTGFAADGFAGESGNAEAADKPAFEQLDTDRNGQITQDEARDTWLAAEFANVDVDHNGMVNRLEYESAVS